MIVMPPAAIFFSDGRKEYGKKSPPKEGLIEPPLLWEPPQSPKGLYRHMPGNFFAGVGAPKKITFLLILTRALHGDVSKRGPAGHLLAI